MSDTTTDPQSVVDDFNTTHGSVTWVAYWTGTRDDAPKYNLTDGKAWLLGGHTPVVRVRGESSCIALTHVDVLPGQPDDIEDDSRDLPAPTIAAERVRDYISANGDGIYDVIDGHPLYARDLEAVARAAVTVNEVDRLRAQVADLADKLHKANAANASLTKAGTAWANEVAAKDRVIEAARPQDEPSPVRAAREQLDRALRDALPLAGGQVRGLLKALRRELERVDAKRGEKAGVA